MQDRFKFRYFNKYANKMVKPTNYENVDSVFECIKQQVCFDSNISPLPYDHIGNGLVFMQCTGLKDKNGKLIYEGDRCRNSKSGEVFNVVWHNPLASFCWQKHEHSHIYSYGELFRAFDYYEVIGNIYENPELLEVSNDH